MNKKKENVVVQFCSAKLNAYIHTSYVQVCKQETQPRQHIENAQASEKDAGGQLRGEDQPHSIATCLATLLMSFDQ
jgi:hypothetical protein